jgi:hypothetical protein
VNIYAQHGDRAAFKNPTNGLEGDQQKALKHLTVDEIYTVDRTVVHNWHTDVFLVEVPGVYFNSVLFEDA